MRPAGLQKRYARPGGGEPAGDDAPCRPGTDDDVVERPRGLHGWEQYSLRQWSYIKAEGIPPAKQTAANATCRALCDMIGTADFSWGRNCRPRYISLAFLRIAQMRRAITNEANCLRMCL